VPLLIRNYIKEGIKKEACQVMGDASQKEGFSQR
jgi:hypothetical protein